MKFTKTSSILSCAILAAMASSAVMADDNEGWYLGGNIGKTKIDHNEQAFANSAQILGGVSNVVTTDRDDKDRGYKLYGGYQFNRYFALEGGYFDLGDFDYNTINTPAGTFSSNIDLRGVNLDAVAYLPFTDRFSAFARLGVNYAEARDTFGSTGAVVLSRTGAKDRDTNGKAGVGLQYAFNDNWAMRLEAERYRFNDAVGHLGDTNFYSLGLVYRFGSTPEPKPVVVTPPPAPAPAPVAPPPAPKFEKFTMSATELFTFDSSAVNEAQPKLQQITAAIKGPGSPDRIVITGYTDRLGSEAYNQKLSERRAQAVKDYMVANGVAADRLVAEGKGEADPVVQCDDKNKAALIKCLAPNRRVEIDEVKIVREVKPN